MLTLILLVLSFICLLIATAGVAFPPGTNVQLGWLGLALFVLTFLLKAGAT